MPLTAEASLKFRLLSDGVRVAPGASQAWRERFGGPMTLAEYATTSGLALIIGDELYVNAPLVHDEDAAELRFGADGFVVVWQHHETPVGVIPVPAFHERTTVDRLDGSEQPYTNYGVTHTDRCRVSPIAGCAWKCQFCDLPYEFAYRKRHEDNLLEVIRAAEYDPLAPARHVLISGGTPRAPMPARPGRPAVDDEAWIDSVYEYLAAQAPLPVDVMMPPRRDIRYPEWLRSIGVNMVSVNLEISDPERARSIAPAKSRIDRDFFLDYIETAVEAFGVGYVQSLVVFGEAIEPLESTLKGVRDLVARGCIPVLSAFRPHHLTPLRNARPASFDEMVTAYERTIDICAELDSGVKPGPRCIPCHHNTVALPDGTPFYVGLEGDLTSRLCAAY